MTPHHIKNNANYIDAELPILTCTFEIEKN